MPAIDYLIYFALVCSTSAFNVDTKSATIHRGPPESMFGFSVALYKDKGSTWSLIGAPKAQTSQPNVTEGGAVFRCASDQPTGCREIPFDRTGPNFQVKGSQKFQTDQKSNQWFGATIDSSMENGVVVACAPRYVYFSINLQRREPVGTCWIASNSMTTFEEYSPCRNQSTWGFHRQGYCQAGMSAAVAEDGKRLFVGAVGSWYWQGQIFSKSLVSNDEEYSSNESPLHDDDSFLGYSSAVGEFTGDKIMDVVVGMPRGSNLTGKVVLFNATLHNLQNITGEQLGSYFGYSVCVSDVNGDRLDDIVVGAPLYTNFESKENRYEEGRVYIIYQTVEHTFESMSYLDGEYGKGRFGLAVCSLKDMNQDGFEDFAVGAPYAGKDEKGIVYIYHGSSSGIREKPSQVITPEDFSDPSLNTLGFSLSGGLDMDNNDYPDIIIGAYDSNKAIFMKSRPVVNITSHMKLSQDVISLDAKDCTLKDKTKVACIQAILCLSYNGLGVASELDITFNFTLDADQKSSRAKFLAHNTSHLQKIIRLRKNVRYCNSSDIYIQNGIRDKLMPILIKAEYELVDLEPYRYVLKPVLNYNIPTYASKELNIKKNCGDDDICIPDLQLIATANMGQYSIGSSKQLKLDIVIHNAKEDAFEAMLYVSMPLDVSYVNIDRSKLDFPVSCSGAQPETTGVNELICDIGNPLPTNKTLNFKILLAPSRIVSSITDLVFTLIANSTNNELKETLYDNEEMIELPVRVEVALAVHGKSAPEIVSYDKLKEPSLKIRENDVGPEVIHRYVVDNKGPSSIREAKVYILWPTYTLQGKHLLYMMSQPEVDGNGQCQFVQDVNPLNLEEVRSKPHNKSYISVREMKKFSLLNEIQAKQDQKISRRTREKDYPSDRDNEAYLADNDELSCGQVNCTRIVCTITNLEKNEHVMFSIRSRLWRETYEEFRLAEVKTSSKLLARITSLPYGVNPNYLPHSVVSVPTLVILENERFQPYIIPWWIIILAICSGLLLLGLLTLLLWKLGFFKRKRPQEYPEKEPLNERNGYHMASGDAAL